MADLTTKALAMYGSKNIRDPTSRFKPAMCLAYFFMKPQQRMAQETIRVSTPTRQPKVHMSWLFTSFHIFSLQLFRLFE